MVVKKAYIFLISLIALLAGFAAYTGIYSNQGIGSYVYKSIRGYDVLIYGKGIYQHMCHQVAIQGIAQDYVTLYLAVPLLLVSLYLTNKKVRFSKYILTSVLGYFFVTYLMYLNMAMYNSLFLIYVMLLGLSFFCLLERILTEHKDELRNNNSSIYKYSGVFLMINSLMIGSLWLSVIIPPLYNGYIIPLEVEHYTTLIVQGIDLALLLPLSFIAGYLCVSNKPGGKYFTLIYTMFLSIFMTALCSKIFFMANDGVNVLPVIFIIPTITLMAWYLSYKMIIVTNN